MYCLEYILSAGSLDTLFEQPRPDVCVSRRILKNDVFYRVAHTFLCFLLEYVGHTRLSPLTSTQNYIRSKDGDDV